MLTSIPLGLAGLICNHTRSEKLEVAAAFELQPRNTHFKTRYRPSLTDILIFSVTSFPISVVRTEKTEDYTTKLKLGNPKCRSFVRKYTLLSFHT